MYNLKDLPIVAYVAYFPFGIEYLKKFLACYEKFQSGEKHKLLICFKGFPNYQNLEKWNTIHQFFLKNPIVPDNGYIYLPNEIGMGMEYDQSKIESEKII